MHHTIKRDRTRVIQHKRYSKRTHVGDAMLVPRYEEAKYEQHHSKHFSPIVLKIHRDKKRQTHQPVTQNSPEEQFHR
ncbi:hypothetical protein D3C80_1797940 [compost metagenome]